MALYRYNYLTCARTVTIYDLFLILGNRATLVSSGEAHSSTVKRSADAAVVSNISSIANVTVAANSRGKYYYIFMALTTRIE